MDKSKEPHPSALASKDGNPIDPWADLKEFITQANTKVEVNLKNEMDNVKITFQKQMENQRKEIFDEIDKMKGMINANSMNISLMNQRPVEQNISSQPLVQMPYNFVNRNPQQSSVLENQNEILSVEANTYKVGLLTFRDLAIC